MTLRHFINSTDLSADDLRKVLQLSTISIEDLGRPLAGLGAALIFEKPSNRTRHSMEMAVVQLGGHPVYTRGEEVGLDVRETVEDITKVMGGYHAILAARVFDHSIVRRMANISSVPVVNMLSDRQHPLQGLADVLTMQQQLGDLVGKTMCYVGDYNNVARSLAQTSALLGMHVRLGCPDGYQAEDGELQALH
ncbi:MAG: ornithine carbamoyltransferase, partial [Actinomycetota bacterium]